MTTKSDVELNTHADHTSLLDALGLKCPEPVMMLHQRIRAMAVGDVVHVIADDPSTQRDIPKFCVFLGHELLEQTVNGDEFQYRIKKGRNPTA